MYLRTHLKDLELIVLVLKKLKNFKVFQSPSLHETESLPANDETYHSLLVEQVLTKLKLFRPIWL